MQRVPSLLPASGMFCAVLAAAGNSTLEFALAAAAAVASLFVYRKLPGAPWVFLGAFALSGAWTWMLRPQPATDFEPHAFVGTISELRQGEASQRGIVTIESINGTSCRPFRTGLTVTDLVPSLRVGDRVRFLTSLQPAERMLDVPFMRMAAMTERSQRLSATATVHSSEIVVTGHSNAIKYRFADFRTALAERIYASGLSAGTARLLVASCLGTGDAPAEVKESFRSAGISHLLCVSGFHVGVIAMAVSWLLWPFKIFRRRKSHHLLTLAVVWLYAMATGFTPSVVRAAMMLSSYFVVKMLGRSSSPGNALGVAFMLVLAVDPYHLFSAGFQLSFAAVAGILIFGRRLNPFPRRFTIARKGASLLTVPLGASLGTVPVLAAWFQSVPLLTVPINAVASCVFPVFMLSGLGAVALPSSPLTTVADGLNSALEHALGVLSPYTEASTAHVALGTLSLGAIICAIAALAVMVCTAKARRRLYAGACVAVCLLCVGCEPVPGNAHIVIDGDSRGTEIFYAASDGGARYSLPGKKPINDYSRFFSRYGNVPEEHTLKGTVYIPGITVAVLTRQNRVADDADAVLLTRTFRGSLAEVLKGSRVTDVIIGADIDYKRRLAYRLVASVSGCEVTDLSKKPFCRIVQNH